jgi:hypothetical protein
MFPKSVIALAVLALLKVPPALIAQDSALSADSTRHLDSLRRAFLDQANGGQEVPHHDFAERQRAIDKCQELTRAELLAPNLAKFGDPKSVVQQGYRAVIRGEVDAMNRAGGYERMPYTCTLHKTGDVYLGSSELVENGLSR